MVFRKHIDDGAAGLGVQIVWLIRSNGALVCHHLDSSMNLATKDHVVILSCKQGSILPLNSSPTPSATHVQVCLLDFLHKSHVFHCDSGIQSTPNDWIHIMEPIDSMVAAEDDYLEDQRLLRVPAALNDFDQKVGQRLKESVSPATVGGVVQLQ